MALVLSECGDLHSRPVIIRSTFLINLNTKIITVLTSPLPLATCPGAVVRGVHCADDHVHRVQGVVVHTAALSEQKHHIHCTTECWTDMSGLCIHTPSPPWVPLVTVVQVLL